MWAYLKLEDRGERTHARIDWLGNITFAVGLISVLVGITYGIAVRRPRDGLDEPVGARGARRGISVLTLFWRSSDASRRRCSDPAV